MVSCRGPGCTNRADKNSNITNISYNNNNNNNNNNNVIITISPHIQNPGIFNA